MDNLLRLIGIEPKQDWKMLLLHEGSSNTTDIEKVCRDINIPVKYECVGSKDEGTRFEVMYVYTTDLLLVDLVMLLVKRGLMVS